MAFVFTCSKCQKRHPIEDESFLGKKVRCSCGNVVKLAAPKAEAPVEEVSVEPAEPVPAAPIPITPVPVTPIAPAPVPHDPMQLDPMLASSASVFDASAPAYPPPSARPKRREQGKEYSKDAVIRMLMSMAAGTMLVVFAIIVILGAMYFFNQASDVAEMKRLSAAFDRSSSSGSAPKVEWNKAETRLYRQMIFLGSTTMLIGLLCIVAGGCQYTVSWLRFLKSQTRFSWADAMVAAVSVVSLVAILIGCIYANYQVTQLYSFNSPTTDFSHLSSEMARQAQEQVKEARKAQARIRGGIQWKIVKQGFIHALFPCLALGISGFRIFKE